MAKALIADFQSDFRNIHFPRVQRLTGTLDAHAAQVALEGAAGFRADAAGKMVWSDADLLCDGGKVEWLVETFAEKVNGSFHGIPVSEGGAKSFSSAEFAAEESDGGPFENARLCDQPAGPRVLGGLGKGVAKFAFPDPHETTKGDRAAGLKPFAQFGVEPLGVLAKAVAQPITRNDDDFERVDSRVPDTRPIARLTAARHGIHSRLKDEPFRFTPHQPAAFTIQP